MHRTSAARRIARPKRQRTDHQNADLQIHRNPSPSRSPADRADESDSGFLTRCLTRLLASMIGISTLTSFRRYRWAYAARSSVSVRSRLAALFSRVGKLLPSETYATFDLLVVPRHDYSTSPAVTRKLTASSVSTTFSGWHRSKSSMKTTLRSSECETFRKSSRSCSCDRLDRQYQRGTQDGNGTSPQSKAKCRMPFTMNANAATRAASPVPELADDIGPKPPEQSLGRWGVATLALCSSNTTFDFNRVFGVRKIEHLNCPAQID